MNRFRALLLALLLLLLPGPGRAEAPGCGAPPELLAVASHEGLAGVARAIDAGSLRILVAGSASSLGPGSSGPGAAWPARLARMLTERHPGLAAEVTVRGARGITAADMAALIDDELSRHATHLVIWQTGTVEATRGLDPDELTGTLNAGIDRIRAAGADVVLMDPQFSRFLRANANIDPYLDAMRVVAAAHAAPLLRRWDLMRFWAESDRIDLERTPRAERTRATDLLHDCLAQALTVLVLAGAAEGRPPVRP